jgi:intron-binding protein aquarius
MPSKRRGAKSTTLQSHKKAKAISQSPLQQTLSQLYKNYTTTTTIKQGDVQHSLEDIYSQLASIKVDHEEWRDGCSLMVFLATATAAMGHSKSQVMQVFTTDAECFERMVATVLGDDFLDSHNRDNTATATPDSAYSFATVLSFATLLWEQAQWCKVARTTLHFHVGATVDLWRYMPERRRLLELKSRQLEADYETTIRATSEPNEPFVVRVARTVLELVRGGKLGLHATKENNPCNSDSLQQIDEIPVNDDDDDESKAKAKQQLHSWIVLHRSLEFLIDLLSCKETKLYVGTYLESIHFLPHCQLALGKSTKSISTNEHLLLTQQLVLRIDRLLHLHICSSSSANTRADQIALYTRRATIVQKLCRAYYPDQLADLTYAGVGVLARQPNYARSILLGSLSDVQFLKLLHKLRLVDKNQGAIEYKNVNFLWAVLQEYLILPADQLQELQTFPLYPTEQDLWDFSSIPPSPSALIPASRVFCLPKLQTEFLSFADYLWRTFELTRLETAYEIRADLVDAIRRVRPCLRRSDDTDEQDNTVTRLDTEFAGWARMALELVVDDNDHSKLTIVKVKRPLLGQHHPEQVIAEFSVDLKACGDSIRREWDGLGEFDNVFLVSIDASKMSGQPAPLLSEYHLKHGTHHRWDTDQDRRIPDDDDRTFPERFGVVLVRGCMILSVRDDKGKSIGEPGSEAPTGTKRTIRVALDPAQYTFDKNGPLGTGLYQKLNLVVRRHGRENNFKGVLETIRGLMAGTGSINQVLPRWLQDVLLGHGDPQSANYKSEIMAEYANLTVGVSKLDDPLDFGDTFINETHLRESFPNSRVVVDGRDSITAASDEPRKSYKVRITQNGDNEIVEATSRPFSLGVDGNPVAFTPVQVEAIRSGLSPGLTLVMGPPGTGKTDVTVQIIASLYQSFPTQRTIVITHSNAALNDIFQKVMARGDVNERYLVRLGSGERELQTDSAHDFTKVGRAAYSLERRGMLLEQVQQLSESLGLSGRAERGSDGSPAYTCETAEYFEKAQVKKQRTAFEKKAEGLSDDSNVATLFPFANYFRLKGGTLTLAEARACLQKVDDIFSELAEYRPLELLRSQKQRADYIIMSQARVVAMTCTHAAIARSHLIELGFQYDNVVIEEAGQMTEIETFVPLLLQKGEPDKSAAGISRLKRVCMMGDHHQLPPVIKNMSFARYSNLDQSMFSRLIQMGVPYIQLDKQGRARPELAKLYSWRYKNLGNLPRVCQEGEYSKANAGFARITQVINVDNFQGKGETTPTAHYYQNVGEAEYAVALFQYMVLIGYPPLSISILTTYNGQKELISDILSQRCGQGTPMFGIQPRAVSTVDQYQGQQSQYIILSLVRTESVGHLRDIRRLIVAVSRSQLGLYILCRKDLFASCQDLKRTFDQYEDTPSQLQLVLGDNYPTARGLHEEIAKDKLFEVDDVSHLGSIVHQMQQDWMKSGA